MISLKESNIPVLAHPLYNRNLAPCDFSFYSLIKEQLAGWKFPHIQNSGPRKSSQFRTACTVSIRLTKCLWILAQTTGTGCAIQRRILWRTVSVVGKSDRYFLFYWSEDITEWTALVCECNMTSIWLTDWFIHWLTDWRIDRLRNPSTKTELGLRVKRQPHLTDWMTGLSTV